MADQEQNVPVQVVNPLQWQISHAATPDGTKICILHFAQGNLSAVLQVTPDDLEKLGRAALHGAAQARSALILPAGAVVGNGHKET